MKDDLQLQVLAGVATEAVEGNATDRRRAMRTALRLGLLHADAADLALLTAVVAERVAELDDVALAGLHGASHHETHRRVREPARLLPVEVVEPIA